jgi:hypothetical protein
MNPSDTPRSRPRLLLAFAAALVAALATTTQAAPASGPTEGAAGGCALQCIEKALVTTTPGSAKVEIVTSVPARVVVTVRRFAAANPAGSATGPMLRTERTLFVHGLDAKTTYRITVAATDAAGQTTTRTGMFETRAVETAVEPAVGGLSAGLGCSAKCITKAVPVQIGPTAALFDIQTNTPAKITVITSLGGSIASIATSPLTTSYRHAASPLSPGTSYDLQVRATDADGRTELHQFAFKTVPRKAKVTFWKIHLIEDGDRGIDRGELNFSYWLGRAAIPGELGFHKRSSGDVFNVNARGTSRAGLTGEILANGSSPELDIRVRAEECDGHVNIKNCVQEVPDQGWYPTGGGANSGTAGGAFKLSSLVAQNALPAGYGTQLPAGHDAYLVFATTSHGVKFRVYAYVDYVFDW